MIKRTIYIGNPSYLKLKQKQLVVQEPETKEIKGTVSIEDIALLMLDHYQITISNQLLIKLQGNNVAIISCDEHHLPLGMMLPFYGHSEYSERIKHQLAASEPLKKQLWKQTVEQKIENQKALLDLNNRVSEPLAEYRLNVKSGDTSNREGIAAQFYWKHLFENFSRVRYGEEPNNLLNFGYAVLRSIVARALVSSGLLPILGIFHKNKYNPYCLADDVMEPYRPFVDKLVYNYIANNNNYELNKDAKATILTIATQDVFIEHVGIPTLAAVPQAVQALQEMGMHRKVQLIVSGGIRNGADVAKCMALGADAVAIGTAALVALGCNHPKYDEEFKKIGSAAGFYDDYHEGKDPAGISTQDPELAKRLEPVAAGRRLANYLNVLVLEAQTLARACGKNDLRNLEPEDLVALTVESAAMARVPLAGTSWVPGQSF